MFVRIAVISLLLSLSATSTFAGEGRNGPTLRAASVPGAFDQGIDVKVIKSAISTCLFMSIVPFSWEFDLTSTPIKLS
jgi:hypothetical protein